MRILFALPGLHRYHRGAEVAFTSLSKELCALGDAVTMIGSGAPSNVTPYRFLRAASVSREHFERCPSIPFLRTDCSYEELTFTPALARKFRPNDYDITVTCSYPFTNWVLRRPVLRGLRPPNVFVTQNGDWPAVAKLGSISEYSFFSCDGLVCINPDYFDRNKDSWNCRLIPNGVDCERFRPGPAQRELFGIRNDCFVVLMVSALVTSKRVEAGIEAVSRVPGAHLVVAGDGPLRKVIAEEAERRLHLRFTNLSVPPEQMPLLYRSADVLLHCSIDESFGNVFTEAMACGLPIVAHDSRRSRWIVGDDEILVDTSDIAAISSGIERARRAGNAGKTERIKRASEFSWRSVARRYREFFAQIVSERNNPSLRPSRREPPCS